MAEDEVVLLKDNLLYSIYHNLLINLSQFNFLCLLSFTVA